MDLHPLLARIFDPQKWREQQAQRLSSGVGSMPYSFEENIARRAPLLLNAYQNQDTNSAKMDKFFTENEASDYVPQRFFLNEAIQSQRKRLEDLYKTPM